MPNNLNNLFTGTQFNAHPHACIIYDDLLHYRSVASAFIRDGLNRNEKCIMAVDAYHPDDIRKDFKGAGIDIESYIEDGKLILVDVKSSYAGTAEFDPDATIKIWQETCDQIVFEGYTALRVVGEATFSLGNPDLVDKLIYYENIINEVLFKKFPFKSLCVYDRKLYPSEIIKTAISAHPILFYNDKLFTENIHYIPPQIYFKDDTARDEIDVMLRNIQRNNENIIALKDNETKFRMMFDKAPLSYQSLDEQGNFIEINENWLNVLGYTKAEVIGRNFSEFLHPKWKDHFKKNFPRFKSVGEILGIEFEMIKKDGSTIMVSFHGKIAKNPDDSFSRTHCIFQDITERNKSEKERMEYTQNLETIFSSAPNILILVDESGRIKKINQKGAEISGKSGDRLTGILCGNFFNCVNAIDDKICGHGPNCVNCVVTNMIRSTFETGKSQIEQEGQITVFSDDKKTERVFLISTAIIQMDSERNVLLSLIETTRLKQLEKQLQQSQKMEAIGNLAGGIAHDFNNILFPIIGMSEMMMDDLPDNSLEMEYANEINIAGHRAKELVAQILAFSRQSEQGKKPVKFQDILNEVLKLCRSTIPANITMEQKIDPACGSVLGNATQLHQIGMNLITNAYHAVQEKNGTITVTLGEIKIDRTHAIKTIMEPGKYVQFTVSDDGIGMPKEIKNKIFDPYFTTKKQGKGTGLGLSVVYGIVKEYGGEIEVTTKMGAGTTFKIYLPLMDDPKNKIDIEPKPDLKMGHEHILLVDDEKSVAEIEQRMLQRLGYQVTSRTNSMEALELFRSNPDAFDMVITDMTMPNMTGDQLANAIFSIKPDTPIIICTGFSERLSKEQAASAGIQGFLMKPVVKSDLARMVRSVFDHAQSGKQ
jgi:PAS domain S-box-containing protein